MLMDQPPAVESRPCDPAWDAERRAAEGWNALARLSAGRIEAFVAVAEWLRGQGFSAPAIETADPETGLAAIEDLGDDLFARRIQAGADEAELYAAAIDVVAAVHAADAPAVLKGSCGAWPLQDYDAVALKAGADLFVQWWPRLDPRMRVGDDARAEWDALWWEIAARGGAGASVFAHRDFHAENLLWLPDRTGVARVGLIDFQDAVRAHPSWDLHSLLHDARRDVSPGVSALSLGRYLDLRPEIDREAFMADYAALAALNEARILGIFARLIVRDDKPRYRAFTPRMWRALERDLTSPGLYGLRAWFDRHVPRELRE